MPERPIHHLASHCSSLSKLKKGESYQEKEQYSKAAKQYEKAIKADNNYAEAYGNLGYCYRKQGQFDKAIRTYKRASELKPDLVEALEYIGVDYAEMGNINLAEKHLIVLKDLGSEEADHVGVTSKTIGANSQVILDHNPLSWIYICNATVAVSGILIRCTIQLFFGMLNMRMENIAGGASSLPGAQCPPFSMRIIFAVYQ